MIANGPGNISIEKSDAGNWNLSGNNSFTGGVTIDSGTMTVNNTGALNSINPNTVTFSSGSTGTLTLNGFSVTVAGLSSTTGTPRVTNAKSTTATLTVNSAAPDSYNGLLADGTGGGALSLTQAGAGTLTLGGNNTYTGGTTVTQGTLAVNSINGSNPLGTGAVTLNGGTLALRGSQQTVNQGLVANYYNTNAIAGTNSYYAQLNTAATYFANQTPAVTAPTTTGGQTNLSFTDDGSGNIFTNQGFTASSGNGTNYEAFMKGVLNISNPGSYTLSTTSSDGSTLWIDNQNIPVVFNSFDQGPTTVASAPLTLSAGPHLITIGYFHHSGGAFFQAGYNGPDTLDTNTIIPNSVLTQIDPAQSYANNVVVTADSTVDVSGSLLANLGTLSIGSNMLSVTSGDETPAGYNLTMGTTTLSGNPTFNVHPSAGDGPGNLTLGASTPKEALATSP